MTGKRFEPCDPFDISRLYGSEKYSLQNMLLKAVNLPEEFFPSDKVWENYADRIYDELQDAWPLLKSHEGGDAFFHGVTDKSLLAWGSKLAGFKATGVAVVRFTNVSSGYPCLRFTVVKESKRHKPAWRFCPERPKEYENPYSYSVNAYYGG